MPTCIATTSSVFSESSENGEYNCFRLSQPSADGTSIVTYNEDEKLRTFVLPPDLLATETTTPKQLDAYSTSRPYKSYAFALYPGFALQDPSSTLVLQSRTDVPIRLTNALDLDYVHATYPLVNPTTEAFICPHSLEFTSDGSRFVAGAKESIAVFDIQRSGGAPLSTFPTRAGRRARQQYGESDHGLAGFVTALNICSATGVLAAGSTGTQVALYDQAGMGEQITAFKLGDDGGTGITQIKWDASGTFLFVAGRQSDSIAVYDIRSGKRQSLLIGRHAMTTQRLGFDVVETEGGCDIWAGGTDGAVRIWRNVISREGSLHADEVLRLHGDAVSSVMLHSSCSIFMTTSGQRRSTSRLDDDVSDSGVNGRENGSVGSEASMKVWMT